MPAILQKFSKLLNLQSFFFNSVPSLNINTKKGPHRFKMFSLIELVECLCQPVSETDVFMDPRLI